jgi:hypothetical protein
MIVVDTSTRLPDTTYTPIPGCEGVNMNRISIIPDAETKIIGYAMDGVAVFAPLSSKSTIKLDECNGRTTAKDGYHYYAQSAEKNLVVKCVKGLDCCRSISGK